MNLVVDGYTADEPCAVGIADAVIKLRKRARADKDVRREFFTTAVTVVPVAVGRAVVDASVRLSPIWILGRVEESRLTDDRSVRIILI